MSIEQIAENYAAKKQYEAERKSTKMARFYNSLGNVKFIFNDGHTADFVGGVFHTQDQQEYYELMDQIFNKHPHIYQKPGEEIVEIVDNKELEDIGKKAIAEFLMNRQRALDAEANKSESEQDKLEGIGSSSDVATAMSGSTSGAGAAIVAGPVGVSSAALANIVATAKTK